MAILRATFTAYVDQGPTGDTNPVTLEWSSGSAGFSVFKVNLPADTDTTITKPTVTSGVVCLVPPANNAVAWKVNGTSGPQAQINRPWVMTSDGNVILRALVSPINDFTVVFL